MSEMIHAHNPSTAEFKFMWGGEWIRFAAGETRHVERHLFEHAQKWPNFCLEAVDPNMGPAQFAQSQAQIAAQVLRAAKQELLKAQDAVDRAQKDFDAKDAAAKALLPKPEKTK